MGYRRLSDVGLGFNDSWRPKYPTPEILVSAQAWGSRVPLFGASENSSGTTQSSSSVIHWCNCEASKAGRRRSCSPQTGPTNSFISLPVWNFPPGWALATVFVNGIPSTSSHYEHHCAPFRPPPTITAAEKLSDGSFRFCFSNSVGSTFGVLASTNVSLPLSNWTALGGVTEISPGQFQFTDPQATNGPQRFYRVRAN